MKYMGVFICLGVIMVIGWIASLITDKWITIEELVEKIVAVSKKN